METTVLTPCQASLRSSLSSRVEERAIDIGDLLDTPKQNQEPNGETASHSRNQVSHDPRTQDSHDTAINSNNHYQNGRILEEHRLLLMQERIQNQQPEQSSRDPSQRVLQQDNSQVIVSNSNQSHPHVDNHVIPDREFLPLCDLLFNLISLLLYIFDVLFDVVIIRSLYHDSSFSNYWWKTMFFFVILSLTVSQYLSFIWWRKTCNQDESMVIGQGSHSRGISHQHNSSMKDKAVSLKIVLTSCCRDQHDPECSSECSPLSRYHDRSLPFLMSHVLQFGIILRYLRLFIPVNLLTIKHEVRDLCMLRMVHAFTQAAPMLLMQVSTSHRTQYCVSQVNTILTYLTFSGIPGLCEVESGRRN